MDPIPPRWSCIAGDAVHNLRSVLDHLAWRLALDDSYGEPFRYTAWPITSSPKRFDEAAANVLRDLTPAHVSFIRNRQPWHDEKFRALEWLRPLDDVDKHRLLLTMRRSTTQDTYARLVVLAGCESAHTEFLAGVTVHEGDVLVRVRVRKPTDEFDCLIEYEFAPTVAFVNGPIASRAMNRARLAVERVLTDFDREINGAEVNGRSTDGDENGRTE